VSGGRLTYERIEAFGPTASPEFGLIEEGEQTTKLVDAPFAIRNPQLVRDSD
jgi:hypothetical protein